MRKRSAVTTAALSLFGLLILGCAIPEPEPFPDVDDPQATTTEAAPEPTDSATGESLEGAEYEDMDDYVDAVVRDFMTEWMDATWPGMRVPYVQYVASGESGPEGCTDFDGNPGEYTSESYEYCPADLTVYVGQDTLWEFYSETGDAGPAMGLAHEYGHHVQYELGEEPPSTATESIDFENQADCIAGTWAQWMEAENHLESAEQSPNGRSDLEDIELMFPIIASAEGEDRDHGTIEEREQAFTDGYNGGKAACGLG
jgi:predicted metalloprotease